MRRSLLIGGAVLVLALGACTGGGGATSPPPAGGASPSAPGSPAGSPSGGGFDPMAISGTVVFSGWQASPEEGAILQTLIKDFEAKYPNIKVDYQPVSGDYPAAKAAKFSAQEPPDLFYVDSSVAPDWIDQGVLEDVGKLAAERGFDTSQFFEGYLNAFKGPDGGIYGFPKDGNTLALAYNSDLLSAASVTPPTNWDELKAAAAKLTSGDQKAFCLNNSLDRALAFIYQDGGSLFSEDKKQDTFDSAETKDALTTYLGWFASGQGARAADLGDDWCGKALGEKQVAMIQGRRLGPPDLPDRARGHEDVDRGRCRQPVPQGRHGGRRQGDPRRRRGVRPSMELHSGVQQDQRRLQQRDDDPDRGQEYRSAAGHRRDEGGDRLRPERLTI